MIRGKKDSKLLIKSDNKVYYEDQYIGQIAKSCGYISKVQTIFMPKGKLGYMSPHKIPDNMSAEEYILQNLDVFLKNK